MKRFIAGLAAFGLLTGLAAPGRAAGEPGWDSPVYAASATAAGTILKLDTRGYASAVFQITNAGSGNTMEFDASNDGVNWVAEAFTVLPGGSTATDVTGAGIYGGAAFARYIRIAITYGSGTVSVEAILRGHKLP